MRRLSFYTAKRFNERIKWLERELNKFDNPHSEENKARVTEYLSEKHDLERILNSQEEREERGAGYV